MASSEQCTFQALRIPGKPVWATQFHPELDRDSNLDRLRRYVSHYGPANPTDMEALEARFRESPQSSSLLPRFLELVFG
jgi:GMP synthase (glutamine-hydrolysing)